jgi:hypothetical protein
VAQKAFVANLHEKQHLSKALRSSVFLVVSGNLAIWQNTLSRQSPTPLFSIFFFWSRLSFRSSLSSSEFKMWFCQNCISCSCLSAAKALPDFCERLSKQALFMLKPTVRSFFNKKKNRYFQCENKWSSPESSSTFQLSFSFSCSINRSAAFLCAFCFAWC